MDGTLTVAVHDFPAISAQLGLTGVKPILEELSALPMIERLALEQRLEAIEMELALSATAQRDAAALLCTLSEMGAVLGILTRNSHANAMCTLASAGLAEYFEPHNVLGRECCAPKPSAEGVNRLLEKWQASPAQGVMVGLSRRCGQSV